MRWRNERSSCRSMGRLPMTEMKGSGIEVAQSATSEPSRGEEGNVLAQRAEFLPMSEMKGSGIEVAQSETSERSRGKEGQ